MFFQFPVYVVLAVSLSTSPIDGLRMTKRFAFGRRSPAFEHHGMVASYAAALQKRDKSPNPALKTYSGCRAKGSLCAGSHADSDIQMGECWSNARVMGQKTAIFEPFEPGHKSYDSEGGPYGICTAYPCYPGESELEATDNLANLCFFWDGTDSTATGLGRRSHDDDGDKEEEDEDKASSRTQSAYSKADQKGRDKGEDDMDKDDGKTEKSSSSTSINTDDASTSSSNKSSPSDNKEDSDTSKTKNTASAGTGLETIPNAPGQDIVPMPMICPHNLGGCYSSSYFESGGKLAAFANAKPTYQGIWFPPKGSDGEPLFCDGLGLGCETPTMSELQTSKLSSVGCDVSKCSQRS